MSIRAYKKDHLKELAPPLVAVEASAAWTSSSPIDDLNFWTQHTKYPVKVSLTIFRDGEDKRANPGGSWSGAMSGRPKLIAQLAPVLKELVEFASRRTVDKYYHSFRTWWRIFDALDGKTKPVETVADLTEVHRQYAVDQGMHRLAFSNFVRVVNLARLSEGLPQLHWFAPEREEQKRYLPPEWQTKAIRLKIKHEWFSALFRWDRATELMSGSAPANTEEQRLLANYQRFGSLYSELEPVLPNSDELRGDLAPWEFSGRGLSIPDMLRGRFPDAYDIRIAFHLCLATTGWNPSVLLDLDVTKPFIETHPKDPRRYLLRGFKARGKSEQLTEGLLSSQGSAGMILKRLMKQTEVLRIEVKRNLAEKAKAFRLLQKSNANSEVLDNARKELVKLEYVARSPWLYVTAQTGIAALDAASYHRRLDRENKGSFVQQVVQVINQTQAPDRQITAITASDFRDAYAAYAYQVSGGMVLFVMKALGHRRVSTTQRYLKNTLLNESSQGLYRTFSNALWHEVKFHGRVDPTILARWSRDGEPTASDRQRLEDYRALRRSRIGVGCKDPANPPSRIAPNFRASGASQCNVHRCTLCEENAVIFPDSLDGLCKRQAELEHIQSTISVAAFLESSFGEELDNTRKALACFDPIAMDTALQAWRKAISDGRHRVINLEGA
ncbi:hypothetical protein GTP23_17150 [Pseudoduganella sp. FT93W]|uniref:Integrase n=1 Tax=Duganella fentianensis TaxID=2692177 RepID=A0A845I0W3_9BURK|nr:site-specific integrase [Duganella fentianensis]MYN46772.1 hypothetical protein [Duganella fentianensis]